MRIINIQISNLLDFVLKNNIYFVDDISVQDPIDKSDHAVLDILFLLIMLFLLKEVCIIKVTMIL